MARSRPRHRSLRRSLTALVAFGLLATLLAVVQPGGASAEAPSGKPAAAPAKAGSDDLPNPLEAKRRAMRSQAISDVLAGKAKVQEINGSKVVKLSDDEVASDQGVKQDPIPRPQNYVELARETTDHIFVILAEFGNQRDPNYPDQDTDPDTPGPKTFDGPLHNQIPKPDRTTDNSTVWQKDFSQQHFKNLYFANRIESVKSWYRTQSSGRYSVEGSVTDWVKVPYNEARYGRSNGYPCDDIVCDNTWALVRDAANQWVADQLAQGKSLDEVTSMLAEFDQWDRYDYDGDGDFNEPDGYIDHFQIVHAGGDQADGDEQQGEDAIWSHRWYAYGTDAGATGPAANPLGGTQIGDTGIWIGDYTVQPENGGLDVFAHEYGHDLGLPDDYDTTGGAGDGNATGWWTIMSQSRLSGAGEPLGSRPGDFGAWQKLQLGWLNFQAVNAGESTQVRLGPAEYNTANPQALVVVLPDKQVSFDYGAPYAGEQQFWSTAGDNLDTSMAREADLTGKTSASITAKVRYDIEEGYDYLYAQASTDGGATWTALDGTVGGQPFPTDSSGNPALTGSTDGQWVDLSVPLDAYAGAPVLFRFRYLTDGGVALDGFFADEVSLVADGSAVFTDGAETGGTDWTLDGFATTTGTESGLFPQYYIAANRGYRSFDKYLETGPYNFGFPDEPNKVEHFPYQPGMLVTYWDTSQLDNNTGEHPGEGLALNIDSHPGAIYDVTGTPWRGRVQLYDAPFSKHQAATFTLHRSADGVASTIYGKPGNPVFDDANDYWDPAIPEVGVKTAHAGVTLTVVKQGTRDLVVDVGGSAA